MHFLVFDLRLLRTRTVSSFFQYELFASSLRLCGFAGTYISTNSTFRFLAKPQSRKETQRRMCIASTDIVAKKLSKIPDVLERFLAILKVRTVIVRRRFVLLHKAFFHP